MVQWWRGDSTGLQAEKKSNTPVKGESQVWKQIWGSNWSYENIIEGSNIKNKEYYGKKVRDRDDSGVDKQKVKNQIFRERPE